MGENEGTAALFDDMPAMNEGRKSAAEVGRGAPRLQQAVRDQVELRACDLESLMAPDHRVRSVWQFVQSLDLSELHKGIRAVEGRPGRPPIDPAILVALWLYATLDGVGSARELARLCDSEDAYRWLCGGVGVNHHTLSDFRVQQAAWLDEGAHPGHGRLPSPPAPLPLMRARGVDGAGAPGGPSPASAGEGGAQRRVRAAAFDPDRDREQARPPQIRPRPRLGRAVVGATSGRDAASADNRPRSRPPPRSGNHSSGPKHFA